MATESSVVRLSRSITEVVAAVLVEPDGQFLLTQRPPGKVYAGYWEFPGGKVEVGESAADALRRELREELGIVVRTCHPWVTRTYAYPHAHVRLRFFRVTAWDGAFHPHEGQALAWQHLEHLTVSPMLPANGPVLRALALPHVYGITCAGALGAVPFLARLDRALAGGLKLVQLREKEMDAGELDRLGHEIARRCQGAGAKLLVNGDVEVARRVRADGVHLTAPQLMAISSRPDVGLCAASCHDLRELDRAAAIGVDFVVLGPVHSTPSHPGVPTLGWDGLARLVDGYPLPVFALGGMGNDDLSAAWAHGAHGIAMMRGAWPHG